MSCTNENGSDLPRIHSATLQQRQALHWRWPAIWRQQVLERDYLHTLGGSNGTEREHGPRQTNTSAGRPTCSPRQEDSPPPPPLSSHSTRSKNRVLLLPGSRSRRSVSFHTGPHAPRHTDVPTTLRLAPPLLRGAMVHRTSGAGPPSCASSAETISTATTRACSPFTPVPWRLLERFPGSGSRREDMRCAELSCVAACQALVRVPSRCGTPKEVYQPSLCHLRPKSGIFYYGQFESSNLARPNIPRAGGERGAWRRGAWAWCVRGSG